MAFAHSHDGGLVGFDESQKLCVLLFIMLADCSINFWIIIDICSKI